MEKRSSTPGANRRNHLTQAAGWIGVGMGVLHVVVAPLDRRHVWSRTRAEGVWNAFTLRTPVTIDELRRAEAFWMSLGSWGAPVLLLGSSVLWSARRGQRVPSWLGWLLIAWGAPLVVVLPASPGWAFPLMGGLIVLGDGPARTSSPA